VTVYDYAIAFFQDGRSPETATSLLIATSPKDAPAAIKVEVERAWNDFSQPKIAEPESETGKTPDPDSKPDPVVSFELVLDSPPVAATEFDPLTETAEEKIARLEAENKKQKIELEDLGEDYDTLTKERMAQTDELLAARKKLGEPPAPVRKPSTELYALPADRIEAKRIEWLWQGRIPLNKLSVLAGNPDQGKSLVSLYMIAQLTRGLPMFGETKESWGRADALIMAAEDEPDDTIRPRLEAAGAALDHVHILQSITCKDSRGKTVAEREAQLDSDLQAVETMLKQNPQIKLVVIDPISSFLGRANMNREQEVRAVLTPLKNLAARCRVAIVSVMHLNKNSDASAIHRIGGAVAFTGVARACWLFTDDPEDKTRHLMLRVKNNIAKASGGLAYRTSAKPIVIEGHEDQQPFVEWLGETEQAAADVLIGGAPVGRPPEKTEGAKEWLAKFLADGEQTATDVEKFGKRAGYALRTLNRAKSVLGVRSEKIENRWCWILPGTTPGARTVSFENQGCQNY
jgi:archaellum biogenesis ATPase FlaH